MQTSPFLVALPLFPAVLRFNEPAPVLWRSQLTGIGPMGGFKNCLSCSSVQCSAFCKVFLWEEDTEAAAITAAVYRGPSSKLLPFLTCTVLLLPFPSCPCAAKPLSNPLERGCNYCFLALRKQPGKANVLFPSKAWYSGLLVEKAFRWLYH